MSARTLVLVAAEAVMLSFFADRALSRPGNMISDFLYMDAHFKLVWMFYIVLHSAVMFLDTSNGFQHAALALSAVGWLVLLTITIRGDRLWHCVGVAVFCTGNFLFVILRCDEYASPWREWLAVHICLKLVLAFAYAYLVVRLSDDAYIPQHALFVLSQVTYAVLVHWPPER
jgi:hypothetical protein